MNTAPDPVTALLDALCAANINVRAQHGNLCIDAPPGVLTNELRDSLRTHKHALIEVACGICQSVHLYAYDPEGRPRCREHGQSGPCGLCNEELVPVGMTICMSCAIETVAVRAIRESGAA